MPIAEDDAELLAVLRDRLESDGYWISTAQNGREALKQFRAGRPDVMLVDFQMPLMNGWKCCRHSGKGVL
ncbi:response regulator [Nitrospira sp. Kam-Ns4a]